jgi:hypothetical protein
MRLALNPPHRKGGRHDGDTPQLSSVHTSRQLFANAAIAASYVSALLPTLYRDKNAEAIDRIGCFLKNELVAAIPPAASSRAY